MTTMYLKETSESALKNKLASVLPGFVSSDADGNELLACYTHRWSVDWNIPVVAVPAG